MGRMIVVTIVVLAAALLIWWISRAVRAGGEKRAERKACWEVSIDDHHWKPQWVVVSVVREASYRGFDWRLGEELVEEIPPGPLQDLNIEVARTIAVDLAREKNFRDELGRTKA